MVRINNRLMYRLVISYQMSFNIIYIMRTNVSGGKICISAVMIAWSIESCEATFSSMICVEAPHDLPVAMVMLHLTMTEAFFVEIGLVLFFLPYTMLFNWIYDYLRWTFVGRKQSAM